MASDDVKQLGSSCESFDPEKILFEKLLENDYPKNSIVLEGQLAPQCFVDCLINDIDTGVPVMIIDMKLREGMVSTKLRRGLFDSLNRVAFDSLKRYYKKCSLPIKAVAAIWNNENKNLEFIDFTEAIKNDDISRAVSNYNLPPYKILTAGARQKLISKQTETQGKKIAALKLICWVILPLVSFSLVLLDMFGIYALSSLRLITIGAGAAAALIPCFKEIKIGEITLKSIIENEKQKEKEQNDA